MKNVSHFLGINVLKTPDPTMKVLQFNSLTSRKLLEATNSMYIQVLGHRIQSQKTNTDSMKSTNILSISYHILSP